MKTVTKISKCIFSVFLAVLCTLGVFFVSYIDSFSDTVGMSLTWSKGSTYGSIVLYDVTTSTQLYSSSSSISAVGISDLDITHDYYIYAITWNRTSTLPYQYSYYKMTQVVVDGVSFYSTSFSYSSNSNPIYNKIDPSSIVYITVYTGGSSYGGNSDPLRFYFCFEQPTPSPTEVPTPTPTPAVTPDPGGTIPTPSGDYGSFFQRMASDAQSAFNALYLSWTNANNRFYSSIFFIGLPLLITVFGIVAGIILGDDD